MSDEMAYKLLIVCCALNQYDTIIFMGGNFLEELEEALRIRFCGFKFRGTILYFFLQITWSMRCKLWFRQGMCSHTLARQSLAT